MNEMCFKFTVECKCRWKFDESDGTDDPDGHHSLSQNMCNHFITTAVMCILLKRRQAFHYWCFALMKPLAGFLNFSSHTPPFEDGAKPSRVTVQRGGPMDGCAYDQWFGLVSQPHQSVLYMKHWRPSHVYKFVKNCLLWLFPQDDEAQQ